MKTRIFSIYISVVLLFSAFIPKAAVAQKHEIPFEQTTTQGEIAYVKDGNIWLLDLFTGKSQQLTTDGNNRWPAWSPDGRYLLYTHDTGGEEYELNILEMGNNTPKLISKAACCATWRGNSDEIVFLSLADEQLAIETIQRDGSARKLIFSPLTFGRSDWPIGNMAWLQVDVEGVIIPLEGVFSFPDIGLAEYKMVVFFNLTDSKQPEGTQPDPTCFHLNFATGHLNSTGEPNLFAFAYSVNSADLSKCFTGDQHPRGILIGPEGQLTDIPWLSYPSISPNGNFLAAERYEESDDPLNAPLWGLIIHNLSDGSQQELVEGGAQPAWRPAAPADPVATRYAQPGERVVTVEPALTYQGSTYQVSFLTTGDYQGKLFHITTPTFFTDLQITALIVTKDGKIVTDAETLREILLLYTAAYYLYEYPPAEIVPEFQMTH